MFKINICLISFLIILNSSLDNCQTIGNQTSDNDYGNEYDIENTDKTITENTISTQNTILTENIITEILNTITENTISTENIITEILNTITENTISTQNTISNENTILTENIITENTITEVNTKQNATSAEDLNSPDYEDQNPEELCTIDNIIDKLIPEDYEAGKLINITGSVNHINETFRRIDRIIKILGNYTNSFSPVMQKVMARMSSLIYEISLPPDCMVSIGMIMTAVGKRELWALKFMDSTGGIPAGIFDGATSSIGEYSECLDIQNPVESNIRIKGQYCIAKPVIPHPKRHSFKKGEAINNIFSIPEQFIDEVIDFLHLFNGSLFNIGVCIPSTCNAIDVENAVNQILFPLIRIPIQIGPDCDTEDKPVKLDSYQWMSISIFSVLFSVTILSSIYEYIYKMSPNEDLLNKNITKDEISPSLLTRVILSFSITANTNALFKSSPKKFANIDFVRFLMLLEVSLMHQYYVYLFWSATPLVKRLLNGVMAKAGTDYKYAFLRNVHNTDFFFALTGLLATYSIMGALERSKGRFNYFQYLLNTYLRFYPSIFGTILMYYLLPLTGTGPFWHLADAHYVESCREYLWSNLLSYNIYTLEMEEFIHSSMCNLASWWATSCFHLLIFTPLFVIPLYKSSKSIFLIIFLIIFGGVVSISHILIKGIPVMNQLSKMNSIFEESFYSLYYTWPFIHHISPFAAGMLTGYLMKKKPQLYLGGRLGETILWVVFPFFTFYGFHWTQRLMKANIDMNNFTFNDVSTELEVYLNLTFGKLLFCLGFLWIFYMCSTGRGGFIDRMLSWNSLTPIYKLSLGMYLTNFLPPIYSLFSSRQSIEITDYLMIKNFVFNTTITILLAYILHILFESPVINVLKIIQTRPNKTPNKQTSTKL